MNLRSSQRAAGRLIGLLVLAVSAVVSRAQAQDESGTLSLDGGATLTYGGDTVSSSTTVSTGTIPLPSGSTGANAVSTGVLPTGASLTTGSVPTGLLGTLASPAVYNIDGFDSTTASSFTLGGLTVTPMLTVSLLPSDDNANLLALLSSLNNNPAYPVITVITSLDTTIYSGLPASSLADPTSTTQPTIHPLFFLSETNLGSGAYYLAFLDGNPFGYYSYLTDPHYLFHYDLGYEYVSGANDGKAGVYLYDFRSGTYFYTSPTFPFPYLYDFSLNSVVYYYPDPNNAGHYNTDGVRYFYVFNTGQIISK